MLRGSTVGNPVVIDRLVCSDKGWHFSVGIHWSSCLLGWTLGWTLRPNRGAHSCEYWPSPHLDIFLVQNQDPDEFVEMMKRRGIRWAQLTVLEMVLHVVLHSGDVAQFGCAVCGRHGPCTGIQPPVPSASLPPQLAGQRALHEKQPC